MIQVNTSAAETALAESRGQSLAGGSTCPSEAGIASMIDLTAHAVRALEAGVVRAHVVPPVSGALLQELYTLDGAGALADCTRMNDTDSLHGLIARTDDELMTRIDD